LNKLGDSRLFGQVSAVSAIPVQGRPQLRF
jgi:hypothetical protein